MESVNLSFLSPYKLNSLIVDRDADSPTLKRMVPPPKLAKISVRSESPAIKSVLDGMV